jgi:uncharacterized protein (TIGR03083 family)
VTAVIPIPTADVYVRALRASHDRFRALLDGMDPAAVTGPSYCSDWSIAQVASHLGSGAEIFTRLLDAGLAGEPTPGSEAFQAVWAAWDARTPQEQAALAPATDGAFLARVEALTDEEVARFSLHLFGKDRDLTGFLAQRLSEHTLHVWDIAVMEDPAARLPRDAVDLLIDDIPFLVRFVGKPTSPGIDVRISTTDPIRELLLTTDDPVTLVPVAGGSTGAILQASGDALIRLVTGRLDPAHTPPVQVAGISLDRLRTVFPGF